ncbi:hypothetical protein D3C81_1833700 [compost metagenome]
MGHRLIFAGEVKVNIRYFIAFKAQERLKRDVLAFALQLAAAFRAALVGKVKAAGHAAVQEPFAVFAFVV